MRVAVRASATGGRAAAPFVHAAAGPPIDFSAIESADTALRRPELDCVRALLPADVTEHAAQRAMEHGVGADRVSIAAGKLSEDAFLRAAREGARCCVRTARPHAARALPTPPRTADRIRRRRHAAAGDRRRAFSGGRPRGTAVRRILRLIEENPACAAPPLHQRRTSQYLFVLRYIDRALAARASHLLKQKWPILSDALAREHCGLLPPSRCLRSQLSRGHPQARCSPAKWQHSPRCS